jgi:hypothetical protein
MPVHRLDEVFSTLNEDIPWLGIETHYMRLHLITVVSCHETA